MSARRLGRLLGSALALAALFGVVFLVNEAPTFNQLTYDWMADFHTATIEHASGSGV
jgi:hypothetical protein